MADPTDLAADLVAYKRYAEATTVDLRALFEENLRLAQEVSQLRAEVQAHRSQELHALQILAMGAPTITTKGGIA